MKVKLILIVVIFVILQFPVYDHTKHLLLNHNILQEGFLLHFLSSLTAGLASAVASNPVDIVKTRIMNQRSSGALREREYIFNVNYLQSAQLATASDMGLGALSGTIQAFDQLLACPMRVFYQLTTVCQSWKCVDAAWVQYTVGILHL